MAKPTGYIYLLNNVILSRTYEHTIDFKDADEQYSYFRGFTKHTLTDYSYIRREREYISVGLPMTELEDINYLIFRSEKDGRLYYAFVTNKVYNSPTVTWIFFEIDVLQTYMFEYKWQPSYISQAHVDRWTAEHKPIYSKTDEGLAYGTEYIIENAFSIEQSEKVRWLLVTMIQPGNGEDSVLEVDNFISSIGDFDPVESAFGCFLVPIIIDPSISAVTIQGGEVGNVDISSNYYDFIRFMQFTGLGNYIRSISLLTYNPFLVELGVMGANLQFGIRTGIGGDFTYFNIKVGSFTPLSINLFCLSKIPEDYFKGVLARAEWNIGLEDTLPTEKQWEEVLKNPYTTPRDKRFESKLLCAPYRYNLLTDWRNDPVVFKNEYMTTDKIEIKYSMALSYNAPFRYYISDYKRDPQGRYTTLSQPIAPEMPIISDAFYTYMLENKNTIQANLTNSIINAGASVAQGAISGAAIGGPWGAVGGAITGAANGILNISAQIRSENAKQADLKMKPDTVINSNDSAFNIVDDNSAITFYRMRICCENEEILGEIFNMTGYKVNRVEIPNTRSRVRFNYIQTSRANITGSFNQTDLTLIKEIYDRGITIWHYSEKDFKPFDYSFENMERNLL